MRLTGILVAGLAALLAATGASAQQASSCPPYEASGEGPDVILIPGLGSSPATWDGVTPQLEQQYRVHRVHVAGFAGRAPNGPPATILRRAQDEILAYMDCAGIERASIVGHSMGGFMGLLIAAGHPDRVERLVVVDSLPFYPLIFNPAATPETIAPQAAMLAGQIRNQDDTTFAATQETGVRSLVQSPDRQQEVAGWTIASDRATFAAAIEALMTTDARPLLGKIEAPTTVIAATNPYATKERVLPLYCGAYEGLDGVEIVPIDDAFHFVMFDQPDAFASALSAALQP
ncbi:Putative aminoacrylate hydrolase RutD [Alteriqipengyuania sp. 357]